MQASGQINCFNVRFSLRSWVCQWRSPHAIKLTMLTIYLNWGVLSNETCQSIMRLQDANNWLGRNQSTKRSQTCLWRDTQRIDFLLQSWCRNALGIRYFDYFTAKFLHGLKYLITNVLIRAIQPIITMNDIIRLILQEVWNVTPFVLRDYRRYTFDVFYHILTLLIRQIRQALMRSNRLIGIQTNHHVAIFGTFVDDINQTRVHDVTNHAQINSLCHI